MRESHATSEAGFEHDNPLSFDLLYFSSGWLGGAFVIGRTTAALETVFTECIREARVFERGTGGSTRTARIKPMITASFVFITD